MTAHFLGLTQTLQKKVARLSFIKFVFVQTIPSYYNFQIKHKQIDQLLWNRIVRQNYLLKKSYCL